MVTQTTQQQLIEELSGIAEDPEQLIGNLMARILNASTRSQARARAMSALRIYLTDEKLESVVSIAMRDYI